MALRSNQTAANIESIISALPDGIEVYFERGNGQMVFALMRDGIAPVYVSMIYKKSADGTTSLRLDGKHDDGRFPPHDAGIVTDPDGWKYRTVKLEANDARGQMQELTAAIKELALA